jgi:hypothetical protein
MIPIVSLWLPILLSAIAVFVVSSLIHMVFTYHRSDFRPLPEEAEVLAALREHGVTPGQYHFPHASTPKEMGTPEMMAKYEQGPVGLMTIMPSRPPAMPKALTQWFVFCLLVGVFVAYLAGRTVSAGADAMQVFRVTSTMAFMTYGLSELIDSIWEGAPWGSTLKSVFDGLLYALSTGGVFAWLWPA